MSDVHGNAEGLTCALERMGEVDMLWCAGDMVEEYRFCNDTIEILRDRNAVCVLGNHDLGMLAPHGDRARRAAHVNSENIDWLSSLPLSVEMILDGKKVVMHHASPLPPHNQYVFAFSPAMQKLRGFDADFLILGHTHRTNVTHYGDLTIINPGSCGQGRDLANDKRLSYAILDTSSGNVEFDEFHIHEHRSQLSNMGAQTHVN